MITLGCPDAPPPDAVPALNMIQIQLGELECDDIFDPSCTFPVVTLCEGYERWAHTTRDGSGFDVEIVPSGQDIEITISSEHRGGSTQPVEGDTITLTVEPCCREIVDIEAPVTGTVLRCVFDTNWGTLGEETLAVGELNDRVFCVDDPVPGSPCPSQVYFECRLPNPNPSPDCLDYRETRCRDTDLNWDKPYEVCSDTQ
jgi:hypothetical protein